MSIDWKSIRDQQKWFNEYKIDSNNNSGLVGFDLGQFQKFLIQTLYSYLNEVIAPQQQQQQQQQQVKFSSEQELQLFKHFDLNGDNLLDRDEFAQLCQNWLHKIYHRKSALVIVDVQNDFIDGSLALIKSPAEQDGAEVVPVINKLLDENLFDTVVYTQDWHPSDHIGFHDNLHLRKYAYKSTAESDEQKDDATATCASNSDPKASSKLGKLSTKAKVFDTILFDEGRMEQILWPRHCVQGSWGAELHPKLKVVPNSIRIRKGTLSHVDAYSAFWDNMRLNETDLRDELTSRGVTDVFFCGLAYDYCVAASALDSRKARFMTYVIEDACRGISSDSIKKMTSDMVDDDILIVNTESTCGYLATTRNNAQVANENLRSQNASNGEDHKVQVGRDEPVIEDVGSYKMRSHDMKGLLMAACFMKGFLHPKSSLSV